MSAVCRKLLDQFGIRIGSHVVHLGGVDARRPSSLPDDLNATADETPPRTLDPEPARGMSARIDEAKRAGNTLVVLRVVFEVLPVARVALF